MIKLFFINNWGQTLESHIEDIKYATPNHSGIWKETLTYTLDLTETDYCVILEDIPSQYKGRIDYRRTIYIQLEPPWITKKNNFIEKQDLFSRVTYASMWGTAMWWSYIPFNHFAKHHSFSKTKNFSCLISNKQVTEGHCNRLKFLNEYQKKYNNLDRYGRGTSKELSRADTAFAFKHYQYSLVCENGQYKNYATEKLFDCFLNWSMPIYWGATNVYDYFPKDSLYTIDVINDSVDKLYDITQKPITKENLDAMKEARELILYKYNMWEILYQMLKDKI